MDHSPQDLQRRFQAEFRWDAVPLHPYKEDQVDVNGAPVFKAITRQTLFNDPALACDLRYFEMDAAGYSTLERHEHAHAVMVFRGHGHCLLGREIRAIAPYDLISIPAWTWHQFRATSGEPLGFLCMVNRIRDKPQIPTADELAAIQADPAVARFLAGTPLPANPSVT